MSMKLLIGNRSLKGIILGLFMNKGTGLVLSWIGIVLELWDKYMGFASSTKT